MSERVLIFGGVRCWVCRSQLTVKVVEDARSQSVFVEPCRPCLNEERRRVREMYRPVVPAIPPPEPWPGRPDFTTEGFKPERKPRGLRELTLAERIIGPRGLWSTVFKAYAVVAVIVVLILWWTLR